MLAPNGELAAAVFDAVERHHLAAGLQLWPTPRVRDFGSWLREMHTRRLLADPSLPRLLTDVEERELWREVLAGHAVHPELLDPSAAAGAVRRARRAACEYGIPPDRIAAFGGDEARLLSLWIEAYTAACRERHCLAGEDLLAGLGPPAEPIAWLDSPAWRPVARRWLQRHGGGPLSPLDLAGQRIFIHVAPTPASEAAAAAEWLCARLQDEPAFRAWIYVPDLGVRRAELTDAFDAALAPDRYGLDGPELIAPYAIAGGTPLAGFAPVRAALEALALCTGVVAMERFSDCLRAPHWHGSLGSASAAASLDVDLRRAAPDELTLTRWLALAERLAPQLPVLALLRRVQASLDRPRGRQLASVWVAAWVEAFEQGPWSQRARWSSTEYQAAQRLRDLLAELAASEQFFGRRGRAEAERLLAGAVADTVFQPQTGIPPVWISGGAQDPWLTYDAVWIAGLDAQSWPAPTAPLPLLPVPLQREYGVVAASADAQRRLAADLQGRWLARARSGVYSCAAAADGAGAAPSPLLPRAALTVLEDGATPRPLWRRASRLAPAFDSRDDSSAPPFGADEATQGVATLQAQSRCAFRGFATTRLGAVALELPLPGFNSRERGILVHAALESIWRELRGHAALLGLAADREERLVSASVAAALAAVTARRDPGLHWRRRELVRLSGLLREWLAVERRRAPFDVARVEGGTEFLLRAGVEFRCRVDRVDRLADGAEIVLDYKTGMAHADWRGERPDNPQLPVYALLHRERLVAVAYARVHAADCGFVPESERGGLFPERKGATRLEGEPDLSRLIDVWDRRVTRLAAEFRAGDAAVLPTPSACRHCHLQGLCRVAQVDRDE